MNLSLSFVPAGTPFSQMGVQRYDFFLYFQIFLQLFYNFFEQKPYAHDTICCISAIYRDYKKEAEPSHLMLWKTMDLEACSTLNMKGCHALTVVAEIRKNIYSSTGMALIWRHRHLYLATVVHLMESDQSDRSDGFRPIQGERWLKIVREMKRLAWDLWGQGPKYKASGHNEDAFRRTDWTFACLKVQRWRPWDTLSWYIRCRL